MLSVKWVCVVIVPTVLKIGFVRELAAKVVVVFSDPKSRNRYSTLHVQFGGSQ